MTQTAVILGANGRFGRASTTAFAKAGWRVRAVLRPGRTAEPEAGVSIVHADAADRQALVAAVEGADIVVNALNVPYPEWTARVGPLTQNVIAAARHSGATVLVPGNVYNFGSSMPECLNAATPHDADTVKGRLRREMEAAYASAEGVRTIVVRAGDYIEVKKTGNWFDGYIASGIAKARVTYPGPLDRVHAWAWLPDLARAAVALAEQRRTLPAFADIPFEGYNISGAQLITTLETAAGRKLRRRNFPWLALKLAAPFSPMMREVMEMRYLWRVPHRLDGRSFEALVPGFRPTLLVTALRAAIGADGVDHRPGKPAGLHAKAPVIA